MIAKLCAILVVVLVIIVKERIDEEIRMRKIMEAFDKAWQKDAEHYKEKQE